MNKYARKLALYLINKRLHQMERDALRKIQGSKTKVRHKATLHDYIEDPAEYRGLLALKENILGINSPWQGVFARYWTRAPKNKKHVKEFEPEPAARHSVGTAADDMSEEEQFWANLDVDEFYNKLDEEEL